LENILYVFFTELIENNFRDSDYLKDRELNKEYFPKNTEAIWNTVPIIPVGEVLKEEIGIKVKKLNTTYYGKEFIKRVVLYQFAGSIYALHCTNRVTSFGHNNQENLKSRKKIHVIDWNIANTTKIKIQWNIIILGFAWKMFLYIWFVLFIKVKEILSIFEMNFHN